MRKQNQKGHMDKKMSARIGLILLGAF